MKRNASHLLFDPTHWGNTSAESDLEDKSESDNEFEKKTSIVAYLPCHGDIFRYARSGKQGHKSANHGNPSTRSIFLLCTGWQMKMNINQIGDLQRIFRSR